MIAEEAGVANGTLFTYFETKADLLNQLYLKLKSEMASAALEGIPGGSDLRKRAFHLWSNWMNWAVSNPEKRRALEQLGVSDEITLVSRNASHKTMTGIAEMMEQIRAHSTMHNVPMGFVSAIMNSLAEATMDFMIQDKGSAKKHCKAGFDAFWRALG